MKARSDFHGVVVVDKPAGMTSHDVVDVIRKLYHTRRVGHTGTLDPEATGVLVLCLGEATRIAEYLSAARKHYLTEVVFGVETDTQDATGVVLREQDASTLIEARVGEVLSRFRGTIQQTPPMVSARHHQGKRLYELAREGVTVEREARPVEIDSLVLTGFRSGEHPVATLEATCSTGTYIRTLAADIGAALEVGGMMRSLRRTWVGTEEQTALSLADSYSLEALREHATAETLHQTVRSLTQAMQSWPAIRLTDEQASRIRHGQAIPLESIDVEQQIRGALDAAMGPVVLLSSADEIQAVAHLSFGRLQPVKVLAQA